jgi:hypothetical protein
VHLRARENPGRIPGSPDDRIPIRARVVGVVGPVQLVTEGDEEGAGTQPGDQLIVVDHPARGGEDTVPAGLLFGEAQLVVRDPRGHRIPEGEWLDPDGLGALGDDRPVLDVLAPGEVGVEDGGIERGVMLRLVDAHCLRGREGEP